GSVKNYGTTANVINQLENGAPNSGAGRHVFLSGKIAAIDTDYHLTKIEMGQDHLTFPELTTRAIGTDIRVQILAKDVSISLKTPKTLSVRNILPARITKLYPQDGTAYVTVTLELRDKQMLYAQITRASAAELKLETGQNIFALIKALSFGEQWL
ncbi:MAG: TOBE domain-containing protein, partial [Maricaulaceae bacterium]